LAEQEQRHVLMSVLTGVACADLHLDLMLQQQRHQQEAKHAKSSVATSSSSRATPPPPMPPTPVGAPAARMPATRESTEILKFGR
jgi:hypothetical protein